METGNRIGNEEDSLKPSKEKALCFAVQTWFNSGNYGNHSVIRFLPSRYCINTLLLAQSVRSDPLEMADPKMVLVKVDPLCTQSSQPKNFWKNFSKILKIWIFFFFALLGGSKMGKKFSWTDEVHFENAFLCQKSPFPLPTSTQKEICKFLKF